MNRRAFLSLVATAPVAALIPRPSTCSFSAGNTLPIRLMPLSAPVMWNHDPTSIIAVVALDSSEFDSAIARLRHALTEYALTPQPLPFEPRG